MSDGAVSLYVLAWMSGAAVGLGLLGRYLSRVGHELYGSDDFRWPEALGIGYVIAYVIAGMATIGAGVAYAAAIAFGSLPLWTLVVPGSLTAWAAHRLQAWVAAKREEKARPPVS